MSLTVAEKGHWRDRIAKRIDQRIETLVAKKDPLLLQRTAEQARGKAFESLDINKQEQEIKRLNDQKEAADRTIRRLRTKQRSVINGTSVDAEMERGSYYGRTDQEVEGAVVARARALEADILAESDLGRQVVGLRDEKDNLLDTVWLATSCAQIKELWQQVNNLLEAEPTMLEEKALTIAPMAVDEVAALGAR